MDDVNKIPSLDEIKERLVPLFKEGGLQLVILFGSIVPGRANKRSDIDLAFLFNESVDIVALTNKVIKLLHSNHVDVIDLRRASPILNFFVAKYGKVIFERSPGLFNEFYSLASRRYIDTKKLRDAQSKAIRSFLEEKGLT